MSERDLTGVKIPRGVRRSMLDLLLRRGQIEPGLVTYSVVTPPPVAQKSGEKRFGQRRRTRLRSGKILDGANRFVADVAILDRSAEGLRLRLTTDAAIPPNFRLFDDETELVHLAQIVWRRGELLGARLAGAAPLGLTPRQIAALRKYYAIKD